ncbi:putative isochorismatase family hydrolase [Aspergillus vadensis CBS 113365]|uniref:Isochorismatase family hydrolase n=1 Tax=Aspergillus vadensis (strain CBS 113365 / IMI 142717 / IBT 24658) TaxID=1448311 RepID=A0A319BKR7_ASPVC|nr:isochorismatase family hydrolase [Aspergillus vadensis CBS 113365]PYH63888.1 isochorismatase family hydrolase [Aspergillus vadensis CBS 113365]
MSQLTFTHPTALLLIDNQNGFTHPTHWGPSRSNPNYEANIQSLLTTFRNTLTTHDSSHHHEIIHIFHSSTTPTSPLHPTYTTPTGEQGIDPLPICTPLSTEKQIWKHVNSSFIGTELEEYLREKGIRQLIVAGLTTDHCVSTTVRMAANLGVVDRIKVVKGVEGNEVIGKQDDEVDKGRIILVSDATATFAKGGWDAETVHQVSVASLDGEFAEVFGVREVVRALEEYSASR